VQDHVDVSRRNTGDPADFDNALHDAGGLIRRRRGHFVHENFLIRANVRLFQDDVSERASDVNADTYHFPPLSFIVSTRAAGADQRPNSLCIAWATASPHRPIGLAGRSAADAVIRI
jgi:hypothetical protein